MGLGSSVWGEMGVGKVKRRELLGTIPPAHRGFGCPSLRARAKPPRLPQGPSSLPWIIHDELAGGYDWPKGSCTVNSLSFGGSQWAILLTHLLPEILKTGPAT